MVQDHFVDCPDGEEGLVSAWKIARSSLHPSFLMIYDDFCELTPIRIDAPCHSDETECER